MTLEEAEAKIKDLTEQLRHERDRHAEKDRLYLKGLAELKEFHAKVQADEADRHAKEVARLSDEAKKTAEKHKAEIVKALATDPAKNELLKKHAEQRAALLAKQQEEAAEAVK